MLLAGLDSTSFECPKYYSDSITICCWRENICYWAYNTIDYFELSRKTVAICMNLFDRYLAATITTNKHNGCCRHPQEGMLTTRKFLLISLTCLYMAIKINEPSTSTCYSTSSSSSSSTITNHSPCSFTNIVRKKRTIELSTMLKLCQQYTFETQDIIEMEIKILHSLSWLVHPPTAVDFIADFLKFLPCSVPLKLRQVLFRKSRYVTELSICDPFFMNHLPSTIAFAAVVNSIKDHEEDDLFAFPTDASLCFYNHLKNDLGFTHDDCSIVLVRERLREILDKEDALVGIVDTSVSEDSSTTRSSCSSSRSSNPRMNNHGHSDESCRCTSYSIQVVLKSEHAIVT